MHLLKISPTSKWLFILVDEVQDYTEAQLLLLLTLFPKASFTLAGDENRHF